MEKFIEIKNTVFYKNGVAESNREINCCINTGFIMTYHHLADRFTDEWVLYLADGRTAHTKTDVDKLLRCETKTALNE